MSPKKVKKMIVPVGNADDVKAFVAAVSPKKVEVIDQFAPACDLLKETLKLDLKQELTSPLTVGEHHVRHLFSKLNLGVRAVQGYAGKVLNTSAEVTDFFLNYVCERAYGHDWQLSTVVSHFDSSHSALVLVTGLSLDQAKALKASLKKSVEVIAVGEEPVAGTDQHFKPRPNKGLTKQAVTAVIDRLTDPNPSTNNATTNKRSQNERVAQ